MKEKSKKVTLKISKELLEKVKDIARKKYPLKDISNYAEATREGLFEFINKNKKLLEISN